MDAEIPAHLREQVAADFLLPILEGREFSAEVQAAMAALALVGHEVAGEVQCLRQLLDSPFEFRALHYLSIGQICPMVKCVRIEGSHNSTNLPFAPDGKSAWLWSLNGHKRTISLAVSRRLEPRYH